MIPFSILDLCPVPQGATAADAFRNSLDLAQHAEQWGYRRYWLAEPDELMITANLYEHTARLRSFEIVAQVRDRIL